MNQELICGLDELEAEHQEDIAQCGSLVANAVETSVVFAVSNRRGLIHHDVLEGGMTGEKFKAILENTSAFLQGCVYTST